MTWIKSGLVVLAALVVLFFAVGLLLPDTYHVERTTTIRAEPERVHELVGDLDRWPAWTPWMDEDPTIVTRLGDQTRGVGAHQSWSGESGSGELTFTAADPTWGIEYDLSFDDDAYTSTGALRYERVPEGTRVTWTMDGESRGIVERYFGLLLDRMVGPMFERGLERLKTEAETLAAARPPTEGEAG